MTASAYAAAFQLCPDCTQFTICSWFNSWVAEAMGVKFLAQGNNISRGPQLEEPCNYQVDALAVCYCNF